MFKKIPDFIWLSAGLAVLFIVAVLIENDPPPQPEPVEETAGAPFAPFTVDFELIDHTGVPVRSADLTGQPTLVFFGFTYCPDICPTTLYDLSSMLDELGDDANDLQVLFVTVDPERDTVDDMATYLSLFHPNIRGLTGDKDQTDKAAAAFFAYHEKIAEEGGEYLVNHNASVFLVGADGVFRTTLAAGEDDDVKRKKIRRLLDGADALS